MKKFLLTVLVILSFLLGNVSMLASIIKFFGVDILKPAVDDLIYQKVTKLLYGDTPPRRVNVKTNYSDIQTRSRVPHAGPGPDGSVNDA